MSEEASEEEKFAILSFLPRSINRPRKDIYLTEREREKTREYLT